jgi:hypothetical protein
MSEREIPDEVRRFIAERIDSAELLEALLLIHSDQQREWSPEDVAGSIYTVPASATRRLEQLVEQGLAASNGTGNPRYRWSPADAALARQVDALAAAYRSDRVAVINLIYARPADPLRSFADAFRLRRDP